MLATEKFLSITHATENSFVVLTKTNQGSLFNFLNWLIFFWQNDALSFPGTDDATTVEGSDGGHVVM